MTYFKDFTDYSYSKHFLSQDLKNIGWLQQGFEFETAQPSNETLDLLWNLCSISVAQSRGLHECDLCVPNKIIYAERHGRDLLLGSAEIRVFSPKGELYAAPTLIYHYVQEHNYKLPDEFLYAMHFGPKPPGKNYYEKLSEIGLEWNETTQAWRPDS